MPSAIPRWPSSPSGEEANRSAGDRAQHLLAGRRLARPVIEQVGAMDATRRLAGAVADTSHHAGPAAAGLEVAEIVVEQQVRTGRIAQAAGLQISFGD